jgi:hypothetical protein
VLVCLGGGSVFFVMQARQQTMARMEALRAAEEAAAARDLAEQARREALMEREKAARALEEARKAKEGK